jgi:spermidine/putrescine transport system permease protein
VRPWRQTLLQGWRATISLLPPSHLLASAILPPAQHPGFRKEPSLLLRLGLTHEPIWALLFSPFATVLVLTYNYLPFMVLALWAAYEALDDGLIEAAFDLGATRTQAFRRVILPLTSPGLLAGSLMVLVLVAGDYLTPQLVGGSSGVTITSAIHDLFGAAFDWPMASALAWLLLATLATLVAAAVLLFARSPLGQGAVTR